MRLLVAVLLALLSGLCWAETVTLQQGAAGYSGCAAVTLWDPATPKPTAPLPDASLYLRGAKNRMLLKFDLPPDLRGKKLARARLEVFVPEARKLNMICEIVCREVMRDWTSAADWTNAAPGQRWQQAGGTMDAATNHNVGRPAGAVDSFSLWADAQQYFPHHYTHLSIPPGGKWIDFNVTPVARTWLADTAANRGAALQPLDLPDRRFLNQAVIDIPSPTSPDAAHRPRLVLDFEPLDKPYLVGMTHTLEKFCDRDTRYRFLGPFNEGYALSMARNEFEGFQVLVYPMSGKLEAVAFDWGDLVDAASGATIPKRDIEYHLQEVFLLHPNGKIKDWYFHGKTFEVPDPLTTARPADLPLHMSAPFWFTVRTRPDTKPGTYKGKITLKPANAPPRELKLAVKVWNYTIPQKWNFQTTGQTCWDPIRQVYGKITPELKRRYIDFLLDHRFNPTEQYIDKLSPDIEDIPYCFGRGGNTIYLSGNFTGNVDALQKRYQAIKDLGLIDHALVYIGDETNKWDEMRRRSDAIRRPCPDLMIMIGGSFPRKELDGIIDIYDPQIGGGNAVYALEEKSSHLIATSQAKGERFFWYVAAGPMLPNPNVQMEEPLVAARVLFWMTWKYGVTGFEYYCYNIWSHNLPQNGKRWPDVPFKPRGWGDTNGDGMLFYPGPDGPFSSVRFENIRDGIEDWESHYVLRDYAEALRAKGAAGQAADLLQRADAILKVPDEVCKSFTTWTWQPEVLLKARENLGDTIEQFTKRVTEDEMLKVRQARKDAELTRQRGMLKSRAEAAKRD